MAAGGDAGGGSIVGLVVEVVESAAERRREGTAFIEVVRNCRRSNEGGSIRFSIVACSDVCRR